MENRDLEHENCFAELHLTPFKCFMAFKALERSSPLHLQQQSWLRRSVPFPMQHLRCGCACCSSAEPADANLFPSYECESFESRLVARSSSPSRSSRYLASVWYRSKRPPQLQLLCWKLLLGKRSGWSSSQHQCLSLCLTVKFRSIDLRMLPRRLDPLGCTRC